jgi:hypothetical protein
VQTFLEVLALRQQLAVLKRKRPRPALNSLDRLFWTGLRWLWPRWSDVLLIVKPEAVVGGHRAGFRRYWRWLSQHRIGIPLAPQFFLWLMVAAMLWSGVHYAWRGNRSL